MRRRSPGGWGITANSLRPVRRPGRRRRFWRQVADLGEQEAIGIYTAADDAWSLAILTDAGRAAMERLAPQASATWRGLGVAILHRLILEDRLGHDPDRTPTYVHTAGEVATLLNDNDDDRRSDGRRYDLAALVMPATLEHVRSISLAGERMPAKSTYFYPKLLTGLVLNPLE